MSEGLKLIAACVAEGKPGILLNLNRDVLVDGPETQAFDYAIRHYREFGTLPQPGTIRENTGVNVGTARETAQYYETNCYNRHANNLAKSHFRRLRDNLEETTSESIEQAAQAAYEIMQALRFGRPVDRIHGGASLGRMVTTRLRQNIMSAYAFPGVTSGWERFDQITGGYQNSDLVTWVARPGLGKTWLLLYQAWSALQAGYRPLVVSTEMGEEQIGRRMVSLALGINPEYLKTGQVSTYELRRIEEYFTEMERMARFFVSGVGFNAQVSQIDSDFEETRPDIVFVDGVYLLRPALKGKLSRTEQVSYVFDELKTLAMTRNVPCVVTSQFNRMAGKGGKEGSLETIGMSDTIGQNSSIVLSIKHGNTLEPLLSREIEFLKGREGESGRLTVNFKFAPTDFSVMSDDEILNGNDEGLGV